MINGVSDNFSLGSRTINFNFVYEDPNALQYPVPENTYISKSAFQYVINAMQAGNVTLFASQGYAIDKLVSDTFSFLFNANMFYGTVVDQFITTPHTIKYYLHHWDGSDVPVAERMYTWRFSYLGCSVDLALTPSGDFTYTTENGHSEHISNFRHHAVGEELAGKALQDQADDNEGKINTPYLGIKNFQGLKEPYIKGISLYFYYYVDDVINEVCIEDFRDTTISMDLYDTGQGTYRTVFHLFSNSFSTHVVKYNGNNVSVTHRDRWSGVINNQNVYINYPKYDFFDLINYSSSLRSFNLPMYFPITSPIGNYNCVGFFHNSPVYDDCNIYLKSITFSPVPQAYRPEVPLDLPIPTDQVIIYPDTELPDQPDGTPVEPDPFVPEAPIDIPGTDPDPIPLPPFATIVSGNDDLWGNTIELQNIELDLLPYLGSLSEFEFPSFNDLFDEYTASIIWVAQIMSLLYNGTPLNILFIALCLFSLVSVLIGAYKLWTGTEPDPENGGRRWKRPPKGGKRH